MRNTTLLNTILSSGYKNVAQFCKQNGVHQSEMGKLINLKSTPYKRDGSEYKKIALEVSRALKRLPEDLFPKQIYCPVSQVSEDIKTIAMSQLDEDISYMPDFEEDIAIKEVCELILEEASHMFKEREMEIIKKRFGIEGPSYTLSEISREYGINPSRARQISVKVLIRLQKLVNKKPALSPYFTESKYNRFVSPKRRRWL